MKTLYSVAKISQTAQTLKKTTSPRGRALSKTSLEKLLRWYQASARPFPWKQQERRPDPYHVWISEVMSQQSTMSSVVPYFERWVRRFPSLQSLAQARQEDVLSAWAGLGYYSRARNVHAAAKQLIESGAPQRWPQKARQWRELPGVGPYTAAAVASICFDEPVLPQDGNVTRVFSRLRGVPDPLNDRQQWQHIGGHLRETAKKLPQGKQGLLAQAFMELGSQICRPQERALCELCPLASACEGRAQGQVAQWPFPKKRKATVKRQQLALIYRDAQQRVLLRQIPKGQRLEGQWELPLWQMPAGSSEKELQQELKGHFELLGPVKHCITHHEYRVWGLEAGLWPEKLPPGHRFGQPKKAPMTTLTRKVLKLAASV